MTKREMREQRRAAREAAERAERVQQTRRRRLWRLGGAAGIAAIIVAVVAAVSASGGPAKTLTKSTVVAGVQEHNGVLGDPKAPVTITEYVDLQCPVCAEASKTELPTLINDYVKTGKVKLQMRTMDFLGTDSTTAAHAAAGAQKQGKLWSFVETFYANQGDENSGYVTEDFLKSVAATAGVNADEMLAYAETDGAQTAIDTAMSDAQTVGADSTPTFTIKRADGSEKVLQTGLGDIKSALDEALKS